jgi:lipopolysaccharide/colanic/teichoic acid biosynthesis glycosyltransferase
MMKSAASRHLRQFRRLQSARSRVGQWRLLSVLTMKRWVWLRVVHGGQLVKRLLDIAIALVALLIGAPIFLAIAALVKMDGGPVFFRQTRIGLLGREFGMLKFRSMCVNAEAKLAELLAKNEKAGGITFKMANDPRVTRVGRFIRRASIDELPQLVNVLLGDMSIVGPRPPLPREVALYSVEDRRRLLVKPGITCLWQVGEREGGAFEIGDRNQIDFDEQVRLDLRYIERQTALQDLWIMCKTLPAMLLGK